MNRRACVAAALAALTAAASPVRGEETRELPVRLVPAVQAQADHVLVSVKGETSLPDNTRLRLLLVPVGAGGVSGNPIQTAAAEVRVGAFTASPWRVKRSDLKAMQYRVEARLASPADQPESLRRTLSRARGWSKAVDVSLESWQDRCKRLEPLARQLLDRVAALTRHRDGLLALGKKALKGSLSAAEWRAFPERAALVQARTQCIEALNAPISASSFPRSCDKGIYLVSVFDGFVNAIQQVLPGGAESQNPEFRVILSVAEDEKPPDYLLDFQHVLAREGAQQFVSMLGETVQGVDPGTVAQPRPVAPERKAAAERDVRLVYEQFKVFFELPWSPEASGPRAGLLEAFDAALKLLDESKPGADDAERRTLWADLQARLDRLQTALQ